MVNVLPPLAFVPDFYKEATVDIDGDFVPDLSHGEVVSRYIKAFCPDVEIIQREIQINSAEVDTYGEKLKIFSKNNIKVLDEIEMAVKQNPQRVVGMNGSYGFGWPKHYKGPSVSIDDVIMYVRGIRDGGILGKVAKKMFGFVAKYRDTNGVASFVTMCDKLNQLLRQGVHVYVADSNTEGEFNEFLATEAKIVGAVNAQGEFLREDRSLKDLESTAPEVDVFEQGVYSVTKVDGGFDITGDNKVDVFDHEVSGGESIWITELDHMNRLLPLYNLSEAQVSKLRSTHFSLLDFYKICSENRRSHAIQNTIDDIESSKLSKKIDQCKFYKLTLDGQIVFDPDHSGRKNAVYFTWGASYASPTAFAKKLQAEYEQQLAEVGQTSN